MSNQKYPRSIHIYKGEDRFLVNPIINHFGGYSIQSEWNRIIKDTDNYIAVGNAVIDALNFIEGCPVSTLNAKELNETKTWENGSKYRNYKSFCKNNNCASFSLKENGEVEIYSHEKIPKYKGYYGCIKRINFLELPTTEEIGKAVVDVLNAADEYYAENPME